MIKRKLTEADFFLIAANLLPVYGVWFLGWNAKEVFLVYCLETVIIGLFTLLKLGIATIIRKKDWWQNGASRTMVHGSFFMFFFFAHYGFFTFLQTSIFLSVSSIGNNATPNAFQFIFHPFQYIFKSGLLMLSVFIFCYGYENISRFIFSNDYRTKSFSRIMFEPYARIFIQQFTVILGAMIIAFGGGKIFILLFAAIKIFFTIYLNYDAMMNKAVQKSLLRKE